MPSRRSRPLAPWMLVPLSLAVFFGGGEWLARGLAPSIPGVADLFVIWALDREPVYAADGAERSTQRELVGLANPRQKFLAAPEDGVFRVFCVGDSTTAGWPYHPRGSYPRWLAAMLADALPSRRVEVINAGFHGFDTTRASVVLSEVLRYRPNLIVARTGYNDYHLFAARHLPPARARATTVHLWLSHHCRLYGLARRLAAGSAPSTLVDISVRRLAPEDSRRLVADYAANVAAMIELARGAGVPIVLIDIPFSTRFAPDYPPLSAFPAMRAALARVAAARGVALVALGKVLEDRLFVDDIHVDWEGSRRIARALLETLRDCSLIAPRERWRIGALRPVAAYRKALGLDDPEFLAHAYVGLSLFCLKHGRRGEALDWMTRAERTAPNGAMVKQELAEMGDEAALDLLATADRGLARARAAP